MNWQDKPDPLVTDPTLGPIADEDGDGDWRNSRHQVFAVLVTDNDGLRWIVPYSELRFQSIGRGLTATFVMEDVHGERLQLELIGDPNHKEGPGHGFKSTIERICAGKKEQIRPRAGYLLSVRFVEVI